MRRLYQVACWLSVVYIAAACSSPAIQSGPMHRRLNVPAGTQGAAPSSTVTSSYGRSGSRARVTLVAGCPASLAGYVDVDNPDLVLRSEMLPPGDPIGGLICRYGSSLAAQTDAQGVPSGPRSLALSAAQAGRLAQAIRAVRLGAPGGNVAAGCPDDVGLIDVLVFGYPGRPDADLWYHASGCESLDNGYVGAVEGANPSFYNGFMPVMSGITG
jgi:hypothetical protein